MRRFILLMVLCAGTLTLKADTIVLNSGRKVEGEIVEENTKEIVVQLAHGTMTIPVKMISSISRASKAPTTKPAAPPVSPVSPELSKEEVDDFFKLRCLGIGFPAEVTKATIIITQHAGDDHPCAVGMITATSATDARVDVALIARIIGEGKNLGAKFDSALVTITTPNGSAGVVIPIAYATRLDMNKPPRERWDEFCRACSWGEVADLQRIEKNFPATKLGGIEQLRVIHSYLKQKASGATNAVIPIQEEEK